MSRRHSAEKREIIPDAKYGDVVLTKFMNSIMYDGKKSTAESIVYGALDQVDDALGQQVGVHDPSLAASGVAVPMIPVMRRRGEPQVRRVADPVAGRGPAGE